MKSKLAAVLAVLLLTLPSLAAAAAPGQGQAVVTVLPKDSNLAGLNIQPQNLELKVDGKSSNVTNLAAARNPESPLELVLLIDGGARASLGTQLTDIAGFIKEIPKNAKIAIAYMENGRAALAGPLSSDPQQILKGLHLAAGPPGTNASPYFCLSDLAKNWPSHDQNARREVLMITDGVDYYNRRYDPEDPYVQSAIEDSIRSGLVVYSFYWLNRGRLDQTGYENNAGQNLLQQVTQATGGNSYWEGSGNPVSFDPYFRDLRHRFQNQVKIAFSAELKGKPQITRFSVKLHGIDAKVIAPQQVLVTRGGASSGE